MSDAVPGTLWQRVRGWFVEEATHVTVRFLPEQVPGDTPGTALQPAEPIYPNAGYLRLFLAEGFLAQQGNWAARHFPALHGGVALNLAGVQQATFSTLTRPPEAWTVPGAQLDFPITPLLPFGGGTVELEAALYQATDDGPLGTAVGLVGSLATLMGPPLAAAAAIAGKLSAGLDDVIGATGDQPVLGVHWTLVSPGAGGQVLRPGHLVVLNRPEGELPGTPVIHEGRLHLLRDGQARLPVGIDYLVLRVEGRTERDDWRLPELDALIRSAGEALIRGQKDVYAERRTEAIVRAWNNIDLVAADRKRVAMLVRDELDDLGQFGVVPGPDSELEHRAPLRLVGTDDDRLGELTLAGLLAS